MANQKLTKTTVGIPNSCCVCGKLQHVAWYAEHDDLARSGQGYCPKDAGVKVVVNKRKRRTKAQIAADKAINTASEEE